MNVRDMHIEIEQSTQQVAANRGRKWLPEEIDWVLNKMQDRFISSCLRPRADGSGGFELDQAKADHIRMLVTRATLTPYIEDSERYKCFLPANYRNLLADWSYTIDLCGKPAPPPVSQTLYILKQKQYLSTQADPNPPPFYASMSLNMGTLVIDIPGDLPYGHNYTGYTEVKDISFLVPWVLWKLKDVYWERFDDLYIPSTYIAVATANGTTALIVDGQDKTDNSTATKSLTYHNGTGTRRNNRLSPTDIIPSLNQSAHYKSAHYSPVSELEGANLIIHRDNSFTVTGVGVSYIRNPQPISLSLNSDCELAGEATHQAICDLAAEYLKITMQDAQGAELKNRDITNRVIL